jgi:hypothetical protein
MHRLALPLLLGLAGCNLNLPTWRGTWREVQDSIPGMADANWMLTGAGFDQRVGPPEPDGPALRLALGGRRAYARLLQENGERRLWRTPGGMVVATEGARVVATAGLNRALAATRFDGNDPLAEPQALLAHSRSQRRQVDLSTTDRDPGGMQFGMTLNCRMRARPLAEEAGTLLAEERCTGASLPDFTNRFWLEAESGAVLRSEQWIGPDLPPLRIEELAAAEP